MKRWFGERVYLRELAGTDVGDSYVRWMNDSSTNRFMETRFSTHTREAIEAFVAAKRESPHEYLFGLFMVEDERHVGNLKIGPVNKHHGTADISYFLGEAGLRGRGVATEAVGIGCFIAFQTLEMQKLCAGIYAPNVESGRVLEKNGFVVEGRRRSQVVFEGQREAVIEYGLLREDWVPRGPVRIETRED
ncbi:GNAT family protein [Caulobacter sp. 17J65-9]|uniref:GNAT family N-acetyltransferase n=1 Tax=Caulobacter sp. 17J65-9 TaxID=2709382 RepID=UPI0013C989FD|nr:GNAT family N-acetyltransferase [Caulobacter sp. 17J65-9]